MARVEGETDDAQAVHKIHLQDAGPEFGESVAKRFCEKRYNLETEREKRLQEDVNSRFVEPSQQQPVMATYPHSMPASPTMSNSLRGALPPALVVVSRVLCQSSCWRRPTSS